MANDKYDFLPVRQINYTREPRNSVQIKINIIII